MASKRSAVTVLCVMLNATDPISVQSYPTKPIRIFVPAGPGGPNDVLARILAPAGAPLLSRSGISLAVFAATACYFTILVSFRSHNRRPAVVVI